jgi:hypothetical protein
MSLQKKVEKALEVFCGTLVDIQKSGSKNTKKSFICDIDGKVYSVSPVYPYTVSDIVASINLSIKLGF